MQHYSESAAAVSTAAEFAPDAKRLAHAWIDSVLHRLGRTGKRVGRYLANEANFAHDDLPYRHVAAGDVWCCWGQATLARKHGCDRATIRRGVRQLKAAGLLVRRTGRASSYIFPAPVAQRVPDVVLQKARSAPSAAPSAAPPVAPSHLERDRNHGGNQRRETARDPSKPSAREVEFALALSAEYDCLERPTPEFVERVRRVLHAAPRWRCAAVIGRLRRGERVPWTQANVRLFERTYFGRDSGRDRSRRRQGA